jgi:ubiquinone/menaquinone biosynthesis C-methylase UbiE
MPERAEMIRQVGFAGTVLDAGCGGGQFARLIAEETGSPVVCVDVVSTDSSTDGRLPIQGDLHRLPIATSAVDGVWCANALMYAANPAVAMSELVRVCRPGGRIAVKEEDAGRDLMLSWAPDLDEAVRRAWTDALMNGEIDGDGFMGRRVPALMHESGLHAVDVRSWLIERSAPFSAAFQHFVRQAYLSYSEMYKRRLRPEMYQRMMLALDSSSETSLFRTRGAHVICIETVAVGLKATDRSFEPREVKL